MKSVFVFLVSIVSSLSFLLIERLAGIEWNYHPDAETYVTTYREMAENLLEQDILSLFNNSYYFVSYFLNGNIALLIAVNIIAYAATNVIFFNVFNFYFEKGNISKHLKFLFFVWIFIFPYRLHLSVQVLKDTLIILFLAIITSNIKGRSIAWLPILLLRVFSIFYIIPLLPTKYLKIVIFCIIVLLIVFPDEIFLLLAEKNDVSMTFREFDAVPTFSQFGLLGVFIRSLIWPIFGLTGVYLILSPSSAFFPVALGTFFTQFWSKICLKKWGISFGIFLSLAAIASMVTGFTSYVRYTFPIIVVVPQLMLKYEYFSSYSKK
jgi:hypothetical protein